MDYDDTSIISSDDTTKLGYGWRASSKIKSKLDTVTDIIIGCDNPSGQIEIKSKLLRYLYLSILTNWLNQDQTCSKSRWDTFGRFVTK